MPEGSAAHPPLLWSGGTEQQGLASSSATATGDTHRCPLHARSCPRLHPFRRPRKGFRCFSHSCQTRTAEGLFLRLFCFSNRPLSKGWEGQGDVAPLPLCSPAKPPGGGGRERAEHHGTWAALPARGQISVRIGRVVSHPTLVGWQPSQVTWKGDESTMATMWSKIKEGQSTVAQGRA